MWGSGKEEKEEKTKEKVEVTEKVKRITLRL